MKNSLIAATAFVLFDYASAGKTALTSEKPILTYKKETVLKSSRKLRQPLVKDTNC